jgi:hypothetical protein
VLSGSSDTGPTECHRTTRANIRSHLYGGPQGWNPHFLRTLTSTSMGHKPIERRSGPRATPGGAVRIDVLVPSALLHLRASERSGPPGANPATRRGGRPPRPSHYLLMGVYNLNPSLHRRPVTRFHAGGRVIGCRVTRAERRHRTRSPTPPGPADGTRSAGRFGYIRASGRYGGLGAEGFARLEAWRSSLAVHGRSRRVRAARHGTRPRTDGGRADTRSTRRRIVLAGFACAKNGERVRSRRGARCPAWRRSPP